MINDQLEKICAIARQTAWGAADVLQSFYRGTVDLDIKDKQGDPVTKADLATNHYILEHLQQELPDFEFGYLTEETYHPDTLNPLPQDWVWVIDPLDGTRDFIEKTGEYAVHIALTYQGRPHLAVVVVPETDKLYYAIKGQGTHVETRSGEINKIQVSDRNTISELYLVASRSHRNERLNKLLEYIPFKEKVYVGSVGCKISTILEKRTDVYISLSGKSAPKDWDFAAPELILTEAGGQFTNFAGEAVRYNKGDACQWGGLMASNGHCHTELCQMATNKLTEIDAENS